jgi:hypothetical protein
MPGGSTFGGLSVTIATLDADGWKAGRTFWGEKYSEALWPKPFRS